MIREIRFSLQKAGDHLASEDLWRALDLVDEIAGLAGVVAVVEELLEGREGYWVRSPYTDPGARELRPLIPFLLQLNPAAQGISRLPARRTTAVGWPRLRPKAPRAQMWTETHRW